MQRSKEIDELVVSSKDHTWAHKRQPSVGVLTDLNHGAFCLTFAFQVQRGTFAEVLMVNPKRAHMDEVGVASLHTGVGQAGGQFDMDAVKGVGCAMQHRHQIDHHIVSLNQIFEHVLLSDICLNHIDKGQGLNGPGRQVTGRYSHSQIEPVQGLTQVMTYKT